MTPKELGKQIKSIRKIHGMSLPLLARFANISKGGLSKIENGKGNPTMGTIVKIFFAMGYKIRIEVVHKIVK